jgi:hypothetical protein
MNHRRVALAAVIAASWLAVSGSVLIVWWLLPGGHLWHLVSGGLSLGLAVAAGVFALSLTGTLRH